MSARTHLKYDIYMTGCGRDLTNHDHTDDLRHVTCRTCVKHSDDINFKGKGKLKCGICHRPYRDHQTIGPCEYAGSLVGA